MTTLVQLANLVTTQAATAYSSQRKLDHFQNGYVVAGYVDGSNILRLVCSADQGVSWVLLDNTLGNINNFSMFIDLDDYIHVAYEGNAAGGAIYYVRGTPNPSRTAVVWSAPFSVEPDIRVHVPDLCAHRNPSGSGWKVHIVTSYRNTATHLVVNYDRLNISAAGTITSDSSINLTGGFSPSASGIDAYPSVDFQHNGDGKTPVISPKVYSVFSAGATGVGFGIRANVATYANGTWTWGTEIAVDTTRYYFSAESVGTGFFDGTRFVLAGTIYNGTNYDMVIYDAIDTTPVSHVLVSALVGSSLDGSFEGASTYDSSGNVYLVGRSGNDFNLGHYKVIRGTWTATRVVVEGNYSLVGVNYTSCKRNTAGGTVEWIYTQGSTSPYAVKFDQLTITAQTSGDPDPDVQDSPSFDGFAAVDSTDFQSLSLAMQGQGVVSGLAVTADGADMVLTVAAGKIALAGITGYGSQPQPVAGGTVTIGAASASDRRDIVVWTSALGLQVVAGTPCGTANWTRGSNALPPVKPELPLNAVLLAEVYVTPTTTTLSATNLWDKRQFVRDQEWAQATKPGALLGSVYYDPASIVTASPASTTFAALDTTNLRVTFIAPPSGSVIVRFGASLTSLSTAQTYLGVMQGATVVAAVQGLYNANASGVNAYVTASKLLTGLTPGAVYTWDLAGANGAGAVGTSHIAYGGGPSVNGVGPAFIEVLQD